jgi:hypothetical protein
MRGQMQLEVRFQFSYENILTPILFLKSSNNGFESK